MFTHDTIAAISSATGSAARMIVRISGSETRDLALKLGISDFRASTAAYMPICFDGLICPAWIYQFVAPRSYTSEDLLELHIPGNPILARMLLDWLVNNGARQAEPGEFTARAYFNGKLDLSQAEGVAAIISAQSAQQLAAGRQLMAGELSRRLRPAMDELAEILALVEAGIDFSDEGIEFVSSDELGARIDRLGDELGKLIAESARFEKLAHEPTIVFAGRPNAGKSTLLNVLAGTRRAVVSPTAGTTRDVLSVEIALPRGIVRLTDIAGIEEAAGVGEIESQMRELAIQAAETADVLVLVRDVTDRREEIVLPRAADLRVVSKMDLAPANRSAKPGAIGSCGSPPPQPSPGLPGEGERGAVAVSAKTNVGISELTAELDRLAFSSDSSGATLALTSRHLQALHEAIAALRRARDVRKIAELLAAELRSALDALGAILGVVTPDDVLGKIFAAFCIGK